MIRITDIRQLIKENYPQEMVEKIINEVFRLSLQVKGDYPDYPQWFKTVQVPGIFDDARNIIIAHDKSQILGFVSLKKTATEKRFAHFMWKRVLEEIK